MTPISNVTDREAALNDAPGLLSPEDREDIQAIVLFGTTSPFLRYHFFAIPEKRADRARAFIEQLLGTGPLALNTAGASQTAADREHLVYVAFTWHGLGALDVDAASLASFPTAFREGARFRAPSLGGVTEQEATAWTIADDTVDIVVMVYGRDQQSLFDQSTALIAKAQRSGLALVSYVDGNMLPDLTRPDGQRITRGVHFGFSDGISEPTLKGEERDSWPGPPPLGPGAFVLGHGDATRPETNHEPLNPAALGVNGTFGAFRIFEQDCDAFEDFLDRHSTDTASRELLAARMCGRWRNGVPLALSPDRPTSAALHAMSQLNDFDYTPTTDHPLAVADPAGARCPLGSHVRRANPRSGDVLGAIGNTIRLIRRGMPYGPPHVRGDGKARGMLGLFLCASLEHQFEFVMRTWINDGLFAHHLNPSEQDPLVGGSMDGTFTHASVDGPVTLSGLTQFVKSRGAAYLFFPSRTALSLLARGKVEPRPQEMRIAPPPPLVVAEPPLPSPAADLVGFIAANIRRMVGRGTFRDAHPKHHGIVRASFHVLGLDEVEPGDRALRDRLCEGLFRTPHTFTAYIRFSNGNPNPFTFDGQPDLRGMAIKLFQVPGDKLADELATHDFILASAAQFFVRNIKEYPAFLAAKAAEIPEKFPLLVAASRSHSNPLTISYFSQTPYACGPSQQVKYCVVPEDPGPEAPMAAPLSALEIAARGPNYLREAMAATLAAQDVTMRFMVQLAPDGADLDDATALWTTPFTPVARITIPKQEFRSKAQMDLAENISYSPWHAVVEYQPLGSINDARRTIYEQISALRHGNRGVPMIEPTGREL